MAKDTRWFSHDYNSRTDGKIMKLRMKHGMEGVGVYWCIVEMLYEENGFVSLDYDRITFELRTNEELVKSVINDFGLFEVNSERFWSNAALERLSIRKDKSQQAKSAINKRWEEERKRKLLKINDENTGVIRTNNGSNTIKDSIGKNSIGEDKNNTLHNKLNNSENLKNKNEELSESGRNDVSGENFLFDRYMSYQDKAKRN